MTIRPPPHIHQILVQLAHRFVIKRPSRDRKLGRHHAGVAIDTGYDGRLLELRDLDMVEKEVKPHRASNIPRVVPFVKLELGSHQFLELRSLPAVRPTPLSY